MNNQKNELVKNPKFDLGRVVMTKSVDIIIKEEVGGVLLEEVILILNRHSVRDYGDVCQEDIDLNDSILNHEDGRIVSSYKIRDYNFYIITYISEYTTIMLKEDY